MGKDPKRTKRDASQDINPDIFFSYGHDPNSYIVKKLKEDLEKRNHKVWFDERDIRTGEFWENEIIKGLEKSNKVVAFLSNHSTRNPGVCREELRVAVGIKGAFVKTILLEKENNINLPSTVSDIQWLDMSDWAEYRKDPALFESWYDGKFKELCRVVESDEAREFSGEISYLKKMLSPYLNSGKKEKLLSKDYQQRTGIKSAIDSWFKEKDSRAMILYGEPGSGKSAIAVNYSHYNPDVLCCFLCEWKLKETIKPNQFIRTMAFMLATKLPDYRNRLIAELQEKEKNSGEKQIRDMNNDSLFEYLINKPLSDIINIGRSSKIIIIDGLDEAEDNGKNPLTEILSSSIDSMPAWIRFIFTSRPEKRVISTLSQYHYSIDISKDNTNEKDIESYLRNKLHTCMEQLNDKEKAESAIRKLVSCSEENFLCAEMLAEEIKEGIRTLAEADTFPKGLNGFYKDSMKRKFPTEEDFLEIRPLIEFLTIDESLPEDLLRSALEDYCPPIDRYRYQKLISNLDSWLSRFSYDGLKMIGFNHKSIRDWFVDEEINFNYLADPVEGSAQLARFCEKAIEGEVSCDSSLSDYIDKHIGILFVKARKFRELEDFLIRHTDKMDPYWRIWNRDSSLEGWDQSKLLDYFWSEGTGDRTAAFLAKLKKEGNTDLLLWILNMTSEKKGFAFFDDNLMDIYIDIEHLAGNFKKAVDLADRYLEGRDPFENVFLVEQLSRKIHNSMFFRPVGELWKETEELHTRMLDGYDEKYPTAFNEVLFLLGGSFGILKGEWGKGLKWLQESKNYAFNHSRTGSYDPEIFIIRNARREAEYLCRQGNYEDAIRIINDKLTMDGRISQRYELYMTGVLANIYTCTQETEKALKCYNSVAGYASANGIRIWIAHSDLGIANIKYMKGNYSEAKKYLQDAQRMYEKLNVIWGKIMCGALLKACEVKETNGSLSSDCCREQINAAEDMDYGSCVTSIEELCSGKNPALQLFFI